MLRFEQTRRCYAKNDKEAPDLSNRQAVRRFNGLTHFELQLIRSGLTHLNVAVESRGVAEVEEHTLPKRIRIRHVAQPGTIENWEPEKA